MPLELCRRCTAGSSWWRANTASGTRALPPSAGPAGSGRSPRWSAGRCPAGRRSCDSGCLSVGGRPPCPPRERRGDGTVSLISGQRLVSPEPVITGRTGGFCGHDNATPEHLTSLGSSKIRASIPHPLVSPHKYRNREEKTWRKRERQTKTQEVK